MNPRALEAGARAICIAVGDDPDESTYAREMACSGNEHGPQARWQYWTEHAAAVITAYEAHLKAEGFVVVPVRPNYDMGEAGMGALASFHDEYPAACVDEIYTAMLSAATTGENDAPTR
jgi:hypothetical protein